MTEVSPNIGADSKSVPPPQPNTSNAESGKSGHKELGANRRGTESGNSGHKELQKASSGGTENQNTGNQTPIGHIENATPSLVVPTGDGTHFGLLSQELFVFR